MATACLLVSLGSRVMHLTLLISVTCRGAGRSPRAAPRPQLLLPAPVPTPAAPRPSCISLRSMGRQPPNEPRQGRSCSGTAPRAAGSPPAPLQRTPSPWGTPAGTLTSHPGTSPGAGALCWRICGRPASSAGRSAGQRARRLLGASGAPCPHHSPLSPSPGPCLVLLTLLAWGQEGMLGIGLCRGCHHLPPPPASANYRA